MKNRKFFGKAMLFAALAISLLIYLIPFALVIANSFKSSKEITSNPLSLPAHWELNAYIEAMTKMNFVHSFLNSLIITTGSVLLIAFFSAMAAYALVRFKSRISNAVFFLMVASMIIPFQALMIPLVKIYGSLGLLGSKWTLMYMYLGFGSAMAVFIYHGFIKSIPLELEEAAMIDGCNRLQIFYHIIMPLLKPTAVTIVILDVLWIWNDFLLPSLVLIEAKSRTLPLSTFYFFGTYAVRYDLVMAALTLTLIPVLIIYLFLQKQIIQGVMQGSIK